MSYCIVIYLYKLRNPIQYAASSGHLYANSHGKPVPLALIHPPILIGFYFCHTLRHCHILTATIPSLANHYWHLFSPYPKRQPNILWHVFTDGMYSLANILWKTFPCQYPMASIPRPIPLAICTPFSQAFWKLISLALFPPIIWHLLSANSMALMFKQVLFSPSTLGKLFMKCPTNAALRPHLYSPFQCLQPLLAFLQSPTPMAILHPKIFWYFSTQHQNYALCPICSTIRLIVPPSWHRFCFALVWFPSPCSAQMCQCQPAFEVTKRRNKFEF
jgi:hypothetical protein